VPTLPAELLVDMAAHAYEAYPLEACGLLLGLAGQDEIIEFVPTRNTAESARVYTVDPRDHLRIEREAEDRGLEVVGVMHSHTHSEPYPSPTDVAQAPDPTWHYVIVSLKRGTPETRSYRIVEGTITEEILLPRGR
jgi:proteasome lid subunit RPN8/RPN11